MPEYPSPNFGADLLRIHAVISRGLTVTKDRSLSFSQEGFHTEEMWEGFLDYARTLLTVLQSHHHLEDVLVFPELKKRIPGAPYEMLLAQHEAMRPILDEVDATIKESAALPEAREPVFTMHEALKRVTEIWYPHIRIEEDHFTVARIAQLYTIDERATIGASIADHDKEYSIPADMVIPFVLFNLTPEDRSVMIQLFPPLVIQQLVPVAWKEKWAPMKPFFLE